MAEREGVGATGPTVEAVGTGPEMGAGPTIETVATRAGVSRQTVSNALNAPQRLRPDTLARVLAVIDELGYRPHEAARSLRTRSSRMLGYCVEPAESGGITPVLDRFLHALTESAREAGYRVVLFTAEGSEDELASYNDLLRTSAVDAFVLSHTHRGDRRQEWLVGRRVPFVAFGRTWDDEERGAWVDVDGGAGTEQAVAHLVAAGRARIGFLGWPEGSGVGDDRHDGWQRGCAQAGLAPGPVARSLDDADAATRACAVLLDAGIDAVVCASDTLALGVYRALAARGLRPGTEVAVVGFDDSPLAPHLDPPLTSLRQPLEQVGQECVRLVLERLAGPPGAAEAQPHVLLAPELVVRASSGPLVSSARPDPSPAGTQVPATSRKASDA